MKKIKVNADLYIGNDKLPTIKEVNDAITNAINDYKTENPQQVYDDTEIREQIQNVEDKLLDTGDGSKFLSNDGTYKEVTKYDDTVIKEQIKDVADKLDDSGDGTKFLSNDGTYKEVNTSGSGTVIQGPKGDKGDTGEQGPAGANGADGKSLEFNWQGTSLGIRKEGETAYSYTNLKGQDGVNGSDGAKGDKGDTGEQGPAGADGADGKSLEFNWQGTSLGVRKEGDTNYVYTNLQGPEGAAGSGSNIDIATTNQAGIVKPDGTSITVDTDGTIHATTDTNKIKQDIEDYMTEHPVSADVGDKTVTEEKLSDDVLEAIKAKKVLYASSVGDINLLPLYDGAVVKTLGFSRPSDGGGATYIIRDNKETNNLLKFNNTIKRFKTTDGENGTIETRENGDIIFDGIITNLNMAYPLLLYTVPIVKNRKYTYSATIVSGTCDNNSKGANFQLEDGVVQSVSCGTAQSASVKTFTASKDATLGWIRYGTANKAIFDKFVVHLQLEEGETATPWVDAQYKVNNHTIIQLKDSFVAELVVENNQVSIMQMGYTPNTREQDTHSSIDEYLELCNKDNQKYMLYINPGKWYFTPTFVSRSRNGVWIEGASGQVSDKVNESIILPFENYQDFIWNVGEKNWKDSMVGGNRLKNLVFSSADGSLKFTENAFCDAALKISYCCYSEFEGLYFHECNGTGLAFALGWENHFGFLNFRGCGFGDKDRTWSAFEIRCHPSHRGGFPSGVSANIFDYFNFEGISGNCIFIEQNSSMVHCEIKDIQAELSYHERAYPSGYTETYHTVTKTEYDTNPKIEHIYLIKGTSGSNYNPLMIDNITISTFIGAVRTLIWTDEDGYRQRRYRKVCGIFGPFESNEFVGGRRDGLNVMVANLSSLNTEIPIWHNVDSTPPGTQIRIGNYHGKALPLKGRNVTGDIKIHDCNYPRMSTNKKWIIYHCYDNCNGLGLFTYDKDSVSPTKIAMQQGSMTIPVPKGRRVRLHMLLNYPDIDSMPNEIPFNVSFYVDKGGEQGVNLKFTKAGVESGEYPLGEMFYCEIPTKNIPYDDASFTAGLNKGQNIFLDSVEVSYQSKKIYYNDTTAWNGFHWGTKPHTMAVIEDRRASDTAINGVRVEYDGTKWYTLDGKELSTLPKSVYTVTTSLTGCTASVSNSSKITAGDMLDIAVTPNEGLVLDSLTYTINNVETSVTGNEIHIPMNDNVTIKATASNHHSITLTDDGNCVYNTTKTSHKENTKYELWVAPQLGHSIDTITCTMGGVEQNISKNNTVKMNNKEYPGTAKIIINSVTGPIEINVSTIEKEHLPFTLTTENCTCDYNKDYILLGDEFEAYIEPNPGYVMEPVTFYQMKGTSKSDMIVTDGRAYLWKIEGPITINAVATPMRNDITYNLTNCVSSETVVHRPTGTSYSTTITAKDGYTLNSVTCTMGGIEQTVNNGVISISSVNGPITITATAN